MTNLILTYRFYGGLGHRHGYFWMPGLVGICINPCGGGVFADNAGSLKLARWRLIAQQISFFAWENREVTEKLLDNNNTLERNGADVSSAASQTSGAGSALASDEAMQAKMLEGVSRTFALTIPQLPGELCRVVSNAYLLCRIVDTIEDEPALTAEQKRGFCDQFAGVVTGEEDAETFAQELGPLLSASTIPAEHELIRNTALVIRLTHGFSVDERRAMERCVRIMSEGMARFQEMEGEGPAGLVNLEEMELYCYYVAGVVGEMLTDLFCHYSPQIAKNKEAMMEKAVSFGQGLQMTNILKDIWEDKDRSACWLPRELFAEAGYDLEDMGSGRNSEKFAEGIAKLVAISHGHLKDALAYSLLIPKKEAGLRKFCLWAIGMALLTLRNINQNRLYTNGAEVKISRRSVKATILATQLAVGNDFLLRTLFRITSSTLAER